MYFMLMILFCAHAMLFLSVLECHIYNNLQHHIIINFCVHVIIICTILKSSNIIVGSCYFSQFWNAIHDILAM